MLIQLETRAEPAVQMHPTNPSIFNTVKLPYFIQVFRCDNAVGKQRVQSWLFSQFGDESRNLLRPYLPVPVSGWAF